MTWLMKTTLFLTVACICSFSLNGQNIIPIGSPDANMIMTDAFGSYRQVMASYRTLMEDISSVLPADVKYTHNTFVDGAVYYISGKRSGLKLNYNLLYRSVSVIQNGDTVFLAYDPTITHVRIGRDYYYFDADENKFLKMISYHKGNEKIKLFANQYLMVTKFTNTTGGLFITKNVHSFYDSTHIPYFYHNEAVAANKKVFFFLMNENEEVYAANRAGFVRCFPTYERQIEGYLLQMAKQGMRIKFYKKEDVIKVYDFCTALQAD
jgi:hypothetical protein